MTDRRRTARAALAAVTRDFVDLPVPHPSPPGRPDGPIGWPGYDAARARAAGRTGERESVVCGTALIGGRDVVAVAFEFGFLGGSIGERTGDLLAAAHAHARERRVPLVSLIATGGSRVQEGMRALGQLHRLAAESARTRAVGVPQIAVALDPTTGGGWAVLGAGADVVIGMSRAQVGFAGSRVRPPGVGADAYTADSQYVHGHIDALVTDAGLADELIRWVTLLAPPHPLAPADPPPALGDTAVPATGWEAVCRARDLTRPGADAYLDAYFDVRAPIRGDRCGGSDRTVECGFGRRAGRTVAYAAQSGARTSPAGYRTAARLVRLAGRLGVPVLTLVDTPGADNGPDAERAGAGPAIADLFAAVATATVPVTSLLIGEGGSGGALALAAPGRTYAVPGSYFAVIAPEDAAAIVGRDREDAPEVANLLSLRAPDVARLGITHEH
ncbi:carboxyl transferase domain-containing protein [Streptomyces sp. RFCAC02]|uniref:carboxyl transferase domain-containing protein n=1 Tax=Streptomyces sp. RFCAC02 TaxID=2499143 RepID=UPI001020A117|nr:carboxyl transferase domain-containing protein [Streptomyces sp. RFCAC02]